MKKIEYNIDEIVEKCDCGRTYIYSIHDKEMSIRIRPLCECGREMRKVTYLYPKSKDRKF